MIVTCLSVKQPWADLIFRAGKNIENRTWATKYRGRLYIAASKTPDSPGMMQEVYEMREYRGWLQNVVATLPGYPVNGAILGYVDLVDCTLSRMDATVSRWGEDYTPGYRTFHWHFDNPVLFERPFPCSGQLGLFTRELPEDWK